MLWHPKEHRDTNHNKSTTLRMMTLSIMAIDIKHRYAVCCVSFAMLSIVEPNVLIEIG
jgi:hypothetical protein